MKERSVELWGFTFGILKISWIHLIKISKLILELGQTVYPDFTKDIWIITVFFFSMNLLVPPSSRAWDTAKCLSDSESYSESFSLFASWLTRDSPDTFCSLFQCQSLYRRSEYWLHLLFLYFLLSHHFLLFIFTRVGCPIT